MSADAQPARKPARTWRSLVIPATIVFALLIGLGTWQLQRKTWKEGLIAALTAQLAAPPIALPAASTWPRLDENALQYHRVTFTAQLDNSHEALVYAIPSTFRPDVQEAGPGYWVFTPARLTDGSTVIVNRGFVPEGRQDPKLRAQGEIVIVDLPGHDSTRGELGCDRRLVKRGKNWDIEALT